MDDLPGKQCFKEILDELNKMADHGRCNHRNVQHQHQCLDTSTKLTYSAQAHFAEKIPIPIASAWRSGPGLTHGFVTVVWVMQLALHILKLGFGRPPLATFFWFQLIVPWIFLVCSVLVAFRTRDDDKVVKLGHHQGTGNCNGIRNCPFWDLTLQ